MKFHHNAIRVLSSLALGYCLLSVAHAEGHLDTVKQRGVLLCGAQSTTPGFEYLNPKSGAMEGIDVDMCHAFAAAVLGDPSKVKFVIVSGANRFNALRTGQVDVVFATTTITVKRESAMGVTFLPAYFYDGTGVLTKTSLKVKHVDDLNGATICTTQGSATEVMWANYIKAHHWKPSTKVLTYQDTDKAFNALNSGRCDAMTTDKSALVGWRGNAPDPSTLNLLPEVMDKSPMTGFTSQDDPRWNTALAWVVRATFEAEEDGITSDNLSTFLKTSDPYLAKFLGVTGTTGQDLGLQPDFVQKVIASVGNYGQIYERNLGPKSPYAIQREGTLNALWTKGGLIYSPPWY